MAKYMQVEDVGKSKYLPVESDNTISLETLQSAFPHSCGLSFEVENKCFVVKLHRGILFPPTEWWKYCYQPIFDDYDDYESDDGGYEEDDYYGDDDYYEDDHYEDDRKNNVYGKPPIEEDINELFYNVLNGKNNDDDNYDDDDYDDDE